VIFLYRITLDFAAVILLMLLFPPWREKLWGLKRNMSRNGIWSRSKRSRVKKGGGEKEERRRTRRGNRRRPKKRVVEER